MGWGVVMDGLMDKGKERGHEGATMLGKKMLEVRYTDGISIPDLLARRLKLRWLIRLTQIKSGTSDLRLPLVHIVCPSPCSQY